MKRSLLNDTGRFREAIPLQLELIDVLQSAAAPRDRVADAHNMASVLYLGAKLYSSAEWHGRQAVAMRAGDDAAEGHEALGAYHLVMARILASRYEFEEATHFGQIAIAEYSRWHAPQDEFLSRVIQEVESIENRSWSAPE